MAIVGDIFMDDLIHGEPTDIQRQVRQRLEIVGAGGGYIVSSSNSLTDSMKPENVLAMHDAIQ